MHQINDMEKFYTGNIVMKLWKKLSIVLQAMLIAFAVQFKFSPLLNRNDYKSGMHYLYAQMTNLLGEYSFNGLLILAVAAVFVCWMKNSSYEKIYSIRLLPVFFSFCLLVGQSYAAVGNWSYCFGDVFKTVGFLTALIGYAVLFRYLIALFLGIYQKAANSKWKPERIARFLGEKSFRNVFFLLLIVWLPIIILSYPGNLCYDCLGQIEQGLGLSPYSTHHPLLHTLIVSGFVKTGIFLFGSSDIGLFLYILFQAAVLAAALAGTVSRLAERQISYVLRFSVVCVYLFAPMYSNIVSTAVKDVPFMAAVLWYILLLEELVTEGFEDRKPIWWVKLILVQTLVGLLRNNGIYVVVLTGIILACVSIILVYASVEQGLPQRLSRHWECLDALDALVCYHRLEIFRAKQVHQLMYLLEQVAMYLVLIHQVGILPKEANLHKRSSNVFLRVGMEQQCSRTFQIRTLVKTQFFKQPLVVILQVSLFHSSAEFCIPTEQIECCIVQVIHGEIRHWHPVPSLALTT